jgi:hypothetical protein
LALTSLTFQRLVVAGSAGAARAFETIANGRVSGNPPFNDHSSRMQGDPPPRIFMALRLFGNELPKIRGIHKAQDVDTFLDECMPEVLGSTSLDRATILLGIDWRSGPIGALLW